MNRFFQILFFTLTTSYFADVSFGQSTTIGSRQLGGTANFGPMLSDDTAFRYSRFAYIYPSGSLGSLTHGDTIRSIEFYKDGFGSLKGNAIFRIYIGNTGTADFGSGSLDWKAESAKSHMKLVYEGNPAAIISNSPGYQIFEFNQALFHRFDTSGQATHFEMLTEFICDSAQDQLISWAYENSFTVSYFVSANEMKAKYGSYTPVDYTNISRTDKPHVKINYYKHDRNAQIRNIYCLGSIPVLMGVPDTIKAIVENVGRKTLYGYRCFLDISGSNHFQDTIILDSLRPNEEVLVKFGNYIPDTLGTENIKITLEDDGDTSDNIGQISRIVNYYVCSHVDPFAAMGPGGIGFGGSTGDFVARFYSDSARYINQIQVSFGFGGRQFQFGIWEANASGSQPGKNIFTSDTLTAAFGAYILPVIPKVKIEKNFFVGIRQVTTQNVAFAYQLEEPVRPNVFYFAAPLGDTNWVPFSPGYDFKFNIQPRLQVDQDVACFNINNPQDLDTFDYSAKDTIIPSATFINYGFNDQNDSFPVFFEIRNIYGQQVYLDSQRITLKSNDTIRVNFRSGFSKNNLGQFTCRAYSGLQLDKVVDNNEVRTNFWMVVRNDMAVDNLFEPMNGGTYELNRDSIWPVIRVINYGANAQNNVPVTFRIIRNSSVLYSRTKLVSLSGGASQILTYDTFPVQLDGIHYVQAYTRLNRDSFPSNDTLKAYFDVVKSNDVGVSKFLRPSDTLRYAKKDIFRPFVQVNNYGIKNQDTVPVIMEIRYPNGPLLFRDSVRISVGALSLAQALFRNFSSPDTLVTLQCISYTKLGADQKFSNDTLVTQLKLEKGNDVSILESISPFTDQRFQAPTDSIGCLFKVRNEGIGAVHADIPVIIEIFKGQQLVYRDSIKPRFDLNPGDTLLIGGFDPVVFDQTGDYALNISLLYNDEEPFNNKFSSWFYVTRDIDYRLLTYNLGGFSDTIIYGTQNIVPSMRVNNESFSSVVQGKVYLQIDLSANTIYSDSADIGTIQPGASLNIPLSNIINSKFKGDAIVHAWVKAQGDIFIENDSIKGRVYFDKAHDIRALRFEFPTADTLLRRGMTYRPVVTIENDGRLDEINPFGVTCQVFVNGNMVYVNNKSAIVASGEELRIAFDSTLSFSDIGQAEALFFTRYSDLEPLNDTLRLPFRVTVGVGIRDQTSVVPQVVPNPIQNLLWIQNTSGISELTIWDTRGRICRQLSVSKEEIIDVSDLNEGMYLVEIGEGNQRFRQIMIIAR